MNKLTRFSPEVRERAVRLVFEHQGEHAAQWAAISSIAGKIGCTAESLRKRGETSESAVVCQRRIVIDSMSWSVRIVS